MVAKVLITGGAGGIGQAIATAFADSGCQVRVTDQITGNDSSSLSAQPEIQTEILDVTDEASVRRFIGGLDSLDILINCAGIILREGREHQPMNFERVIDVNLNGTMRMCAACRPLLAKSQGCVLNLASMLSFFGSGSAPAYSASKGAIVQLTKSLAIAWAADGIRVNAIAPGWIETDMTRPLILNPDRNRAILDRTPMRRWGKPEDLTGAALFLCSPHASFITGAILPVDGGYSSS